MQLQVALDRVDLDTAARITAAVSNHADWVEVGTSLIKRYGMRSVSEVVAVAGATPVLADLKTVDDAATEFGLAFEHGARAATVLAAATDATIDRCVTLARDAGAEVVLDLLATSDARRNALLEHLPTEVVFAAHVGKDSQGAGIGLDSVLGDWVHDRRIAVAGGITEADVVPLARVCGEQTRVIVGSEVSRSTDPGAVARRLSTVMRTRSAS